MGSLRGETMAVRRTVIYPAPATPRRRDTAETSPPTTVNSGTRSNYMVDGGRLRQRPSSSSSLSRGLKPTSPSAGMTSGYDQGRKSHRAMNGWSQSQSDVFASDTEATAPAAGRYSSVVRPHRMHKVRTIATDDFVACL